MASIAYTSSQLANWIPEYQAAKALAALETSLVIAKTVWHDWQDDLAWGDVLNIPLLPNFGTADSVDTTATITLDVDTVNKKTITVNQWNYKAVGVSYKDQLQNRPEFLTGANEKCQYSVALAMDTFLASLLPSLTAGNVGTQGVAIDDDVMLAALENLNAADAGEEDRHIILDPESITDMLKIDKMVRDDYVARGATENPMKGLIGRSRYGGTVWMSNNLKVQNSSYHTAAFMQREAIAMISQRNNLVDFFDWPQQFTNVVRAQSIFGATVVRPTVGVAINTRS